MADGSRSPKRDQRAFRFPPLPALCRLRPGEIVVDLFAGGGGASTAIEHALGRPVDIAVNHNPWAVSLHAANHPYTRHLCQDVWEADPRIECDGRAVSTSRAAAMVGNSVSPPSLAAILEANFDHAQEALAA